MNENTAGIKLAIGGFLIIVAIIAFAILNPFVQIGAGERGVVMNWGQVQETILPEGLHFRIPIMQSVQVVSVRVQKSDVKTSGASKDLQDVGLELVVNWKINTARVNKVYQTIGDEKAVLDNIIIPAVSEMAKAATAKKTAEEIITKRQELKKDIDTLLVDRLGQYGIILSDVSIISIDFSDEFNKAIEAKTSADQKAQKAANDLKRIDIEAKQIVSRAKADAESIRIQAEALRENPELTNWEAVKKWNGVLPQYMLGGTTPFINLSK